MKNIEIDGLQIVPSAKAGALQWYQNAVDKIRIRLKYLLIFSALLPLPGCAPVHFWANRDFPLPLCDGSNNKSCREAVFNSDSDLPTGYVAAGVFTDGYHPGVRPKLGVALAGGGSKSAPFAMGALKRFVDEGWIKNVDYISSVSGGGYAALFLYHKAYTFVQAREKCQTKDDSSCLEDYFFDSRQECYKGDCNNNDLNFDTNDYAVTKGKDSKSRKCSLFSHTVGKNAYQERLECYQDILFPWTGGVYDMPWLTTPASFIGTLPLLAGTAASLPFHHLANTVFDWRLKLSPTQWFYQAGIIRSYGFEVEQGELSSDRVLQNLPFNHDFTFTQLKKLYTDQARKILGHGLPIWIMNATVPDNDTWLQGIATNVPYDFGRNIFEISPFHFGAGMYNYVQGSPEIVGMDVFSAVAASAAFLDGTKRDLYPVALSGGLGALNLAWGLDIPNYNVATSERFWHSFLPFPFYYFDGDFADTQNNYIHLADGGQSGDNLGLVALLRRNVENAVIFDGAEDNAGGLSYLNELCAVNAYLQNNGYEMIFTDHPNSANCSGDFILADQCDSTTRKLKIGVDSSNWKWDKAVWQGRIIKKRPHGSLYLGSEPINTSQSNQTVTNIFYVKSAIDWKDQWEKFQTTTLWPLIKAPKGEECKAIIKIDPNGNIDPAGKTEIYSTISSYLLDFCEKPDFPQNSTVFSTYNGNANRFKAYRDLGWFLAGELKKTGVYPLLKQNLVEHKFEETSKNCQPPSKP
jgi:hypothetical protein